MTGLFQPVANNLLCDRNTPPELPSLNDIIGSIDCVKWFSIRKLSKQTRCLKNRQGFHTDKRNWSSFLLILFITPHRFTILLMHFSQDKRLSPLAFSHYNSIKLNTFAIQKGTKPHPSHNAFGIPTGNPCQEENVPRIELENVESS